ncbi:hypothetical protein GHT06_022650 [Daphnia sinensis]|uniref:Alpha 1,4-glycosyltransferase domain-containing protein n=1 Tax=Daphnia sinensis TaxID=1820382 RepID=A0AAD5PLU7_9CRUS|nr:hypothetical protein GHT06_022650 [Daphnia sinensis]
MRLCRSGHAYHLLNQSREECVFTLSDCPRRWRSLSVTRHHIFFATSCLLFVTVLAYNFITSETYLHQMNPRVNVRRAVRSRCCLAGTTSGSDMCGRPDCVWPCPVPKLPEHKHLNAVQDKAFFHETSGASTLNFRQACVVESLAFHNPNLTVHLLMTGSKIDDDTATMKTLRQNYPNIQITSINLGDYMANTPLERWYFCTDWNRGWFAVSHLSDALRFLTLSKYGGYYFDLDVIQLRPVTSYRNFVVAEDNDKLGSSVIHVDHQHPVIQAAVETFSADYKWYVWSHNGPDLVTRILQKWCQVYYISWMTPKRCHGFRILAPKSFYPVHYFHWRDYFYKRDDTPQDKLSWDESVVGAHVWNSLSSKWLVNKYSNQYYAQMARSSCPRIFDVAPEQF